MRSLKRAREQARDCRRKIGGGKEGLLERVINYLEDEHQIELIPANSHFLQNGHALLKPAEGCLYYDRKYDDDPVARLKVILHELGHLELHGRLKKLCSEPDPVYGSIFTRFTRNWPKLFSGPRAPRAPRRERSGSRVSSVTTARSPPRSSRALPRWSAPGLGPVRPRRWSDASNTCWKNSARSLKAYWY